MISLTKMKGMTWASPVFILSIAAITFAVLLFITSALFMTHNNLLTLLHIAEKNEERFVNYDARLLGMDSEIQILQSNDIEHTVLISNIQDRQQEIIETSAFWQAMVKEHNISLIEAGFYRKKQ